MSDRIFHADSKKFAKNIYDTRKGRLRELILQTDLHFLYEQEGLQLLDIGAGLGQVNQWFAEQGHKVTHLEASQDMIEAAKIRHAQAGLSAQYTYLHQPLQALETQTQTYDLVLCHAVLEWLEDPFTAIRFAVQAMKPGGWLSLMFYNRAAQKIVNMAYGNLDYVAAGLVVKKKVRFSPKKACHIDEVKNWLTQFPVDIIKHSGVRCFNDYIKSKTPIDEALLSQLELEHRRTEPYRSLGRYQHFLLRKR